MPNLGAGAPAVMTKAATAEEVVAFHPGNSGDGGDGNGGSGGDNNQSHDAQGSAKHAAGRGDGQAQWARPVHETPTAAPGQGNGPGTGAGPPAQAHHPHAAA